MKNKHSFFGLLIVCRSCFPFFVDWGGRPKNGSPAGVISGRWSVPHIPHIPAIPHTSTCDAHPNIVVNFIVKHSKLLNFKRFTGTRNLIPRRPIIKDVNSHPLDIYGGI